MLDATNEDFSPVKKGRNLDGDDPENLCDKCGSPKMTNKPFMPMPRIGRKHP